MRALDAYPKVLPDFKKGSKTGGALTIIVVMISMWLFTSELIEHLQGTTHYDADVDVERTAHQKLTLNVDMTIATRCEFLSADVVDVTGTHVGDVMHTLQHQPVQWELKVPSPDLVDSHWKTKTSSFVGLHDIVRLAGIKMPMAGIPLAGNQEAAGKPVSLQETIRKAAAGHTKEGESHPLPIVSIDKKTNTTQVLKPGTQKPSASDMASLRAQLDGKTLPTAKADASLNACRIFGSLLASKVRGNFHITAGRSIDRGGGHVHDMHLVPPGALNFTHRIHRLSFGENFPGIVAPADTLVYHTSHGLQMYQYFVKVVPTEYKESGELPVDTYQYSLTANSRTVDHSSGMHGLPGLFFNYEFEPVKIYVTETYPSFFHFVTRCCAIIGGVFAVSGVVVAITNHFLNIMAHKLGKRQTPLKR